MADSTCPLGKYLFEDALRSSEGAFRCLSRGRQPTDATMSSYDFPKCNDTDKLKCSWYKTYAPAVLQDA